MLFEPDHAAVVAKAATLPADEQGLVLARLAQRESEWKSYLAKYQGYARPLDQGGGVPVEFDWTGNGISTQPNPGGGNLKSFDLSNVGTACSARPANYFLPRIADPSGTLRVITGDVDVVGIVEANGRAILSAAERIDIYKNLMLILDMQHPETLMWLTGGAKQVDLLVDHVGPNAERLAVFGPDGNAFTASISPFLTTFDANNALLGVWFNGAYKSSTALAYHYADIGAAILQNVTRVATNNYISAASWFVTTVNQLPRPSPTSIHANNGMQLASAHLAASTNHAPSGDNHGMIGDCPWQFSTDGNATVAVGVEHGGLLQWSATSGKWTSYDITPRSVTGSHPTIHLLPQSALINDAAAGATRAAVYGLASIDPGVPASTPWFAAGQEVVLDPGKSNQETDSIKSLSPLTFDHPLRFAHSAGAIVSLVHGEGTSLWIPILALVLGLALVFLVLRVRGRIKKGATSSKVAAV